MRLLLGTVQINYLVSYYPNTTAEKCSALLGRQRGSFRLITHSKHALQRAGFIKNSLAQAVSAESIIVRVIEPTLARLKPSLAN